MISSIRGTVLEIGLDHLIIETGGIGYTIMTTPATLAGLGIGQQLQLITAMIVREDSITLYGFPDFHSRDLFMTLLSVSGIGPKIALAALTVHEPAQLRSALINRNREALIRIPGIGKRSAERLIVELSDRLATSPDIQPINTDSGIRTPVIQALVGLGFPLKQAEDTTDTVLSSHQGSTTSEVLRAALQMLSHQQ